MLRPFSDHLIDDAQQSRIEVPDRDPRSISERYFEIHPIERYELRSLIGRGEAGPSVEFLDAGFSCDAIFGLSIEKLAVCNRE